MLPISSWSLITIGSETEKLYYFHNLITTETPNKNNNNNNNNNVGSRWIDPQAELRRLASQAGGWLSGEIWLKSASLINRLKLNFNDFLQVPAAIGTCGTETAKKLMNDTVY